MRRTAVEDQVHAVTELVEDPGRIARLRAARRRWPRWSAAARRRGQRTGSVVIRHAEADRRRATGQGRGQRHLRPAGDDDGQSARPERVGECGGRRCP